MKSFLRKDIELALIFALLFTLAMNFAHFNAACDDLRNNVLRLHIIANSDSKPDQAVKLKIRDEILNASSGIFKECESLPAAIENAKENLDKISERANNVLKENGFDYEAIVSVGNSYFETREYENFTLPAGTYKSLIVRLGKSKGHNWWCVIFPSVCLSASGNARLEDATSITSARIAENPKKYVMRFKSVELYENLKKKIKSKK
ncbi:MAG: stage II sporulation protein R [Clostridia bacterium]|nr:stage II sporulation protein R [Clostridia bacterium]